MQRLIEEGLRFGGLLHIDAAHLVERYNAALTAFGLPATKLTDFYIDASGYSYEVALEMGNAAYLDPKGIYRRFIILSPDQADLPLIRTSFSADGQVVRAFFAANDRMVRAVTLKDALYGEIENLVFDVDRPADVLGIRDVRFIVRTPSGLLEQAQALKVKIDRFLDEPDSWQDAGLLDAIVEGASRVGDVRRNGFLPRDLTFRWPEVFWPSHFGGAYVVANDNGSVMIVDPDQLQPKPFGASIIALHETPVLFSFLEEQRLMEPFNARWLKESGILDHRLKLLVAELLMLGDHSFDATPMIEDQYLSRWIADNMVKLNPDRRFRVISQMRSLLDTPAEAEAYERRLTPEQRFYFRRAMPDVPGAGDINRIIVEHLPFDLLSTFILNKRRFYDIYETYTERQQAFAVDYLTTHYAPNTHDRWRMRAKVREAFFGLHKPAQEGRDPCSNPLSIGFGAGPGKVGTGFPSGPATTKSKDQGCVRPHHRLDQSHVAGVHRAVQAAPAQARGGRPGKDARYARHGPDLLARGLADLHHPVRHLERALLLERALDARRQLVLSADGTVADRSGRLQRDSVARWRQ